MSAHTPGPWSVSTAPGTVDVRAPNGDFVAQCDVDKRRGLAVTDANAKLIAAAPEMYSRSGALLNRLMEFLNGDCDEETLRVAVRDLDGTLAKAEGRS